MARYDDIDPQDINPDTGRPYPNYSSPSLDTSFHDHEMARSDGPWLRWCAEAERLVGHDLDGDQEEDGFSLDYAYEAFLRGVTPATYAGFGGANG